MNAIFTIIVIAFLLLALWMMWKIWVWFLKILFGVHDKPTIVSQRTAGAAASGDAADEIDGMNEGDLHSGPYGYSPNTAYPETQYGSHFDPDADWAHEHED